MDEHKSTDGQEISLANSQISPTGSLEAGSEDGFPIDYSFMKTDVPQITEKVEATHIAAGGKRYYLKDLHYDLETDSYEPRQNAKEVQGISNDVTKSPSEKSKPYETPQKVEVVQKPENKPLKPTSDKKEEAENKVLPKETQSKDISETSHRNEQLKEQNRLLLEQNILLKDKIEKTEKKFDQVVMLLIRVGRIPASSISLLYDTSLGKEIQPVEANIATKPLTEVDKIVATPEPMDKQLDKAINNLIQNSPKIEQTPPPLPNNMTPPPLPKMEFTSSNYPAVNVELGTGEKVSDITKLYSILSPKGQASLQLAFAEVQDMADRYHHTKQPLKVVSIRSKLNNEDRAIFDQWERDYRMNLLNS